MANSLFHGVDEAMDGRPRDDDPRHDSDVPTLTPNAEQPAYAGQKDSGQTNVIIPPTREDGKIVLGEADCYDILGFSWPWWRKWRILSVIFAVQVSMNFNASVYGNALHGGNKEGMLEDFGISEIYGRYGQMIFLIAYAFGCELWAPWSEEYGRRLILQLSLLFVNIWQIPCALATNFNTILAGRFLGGLSSAGGSVTLGMVADMWEADDQQYAVAFVVFSSVAGSVVGPVVGGFIQTYLSWRWVFWIQLIFGVAAQILHFWLVPETRTSVLLDRAAKARRTAGEVEIYGPGEVAERMTVKHIIKIWVRPFEMFVREPIVLFLSLLSGFSDALIFTFLDSYGPVYRQWGFSTIQVGLAFLPLLVGYFIAYFSFFPFIHRDHQVMKKDPGALTPERRLFWLLFTAPLETIGLFGFAWTSIGPPAVHWIAPMVFSTLVGIANYAIYMATIDYMVASYGPYSASATGGNGFARDFLAGTAALYATPFYQNIGEKYKLEWPSTILACLAAMFTVPIYLFYWKGPAIRKRSKFAQTLAADSRVKNEKMRGIADGTVTPAMGSSRVNSRLNSRRNSLTGQPVSNRQAPGTEIGTGSKVGIVDGETLIV